ncbi:hypothetical protein PC120_g25871 [Phytophthora cactorum]|nr:hypothetical protein PC120_g25871 [Phytophthora cactorum]
MFKLKKEADAKASAWSAMPRRFWALHYFCNPLSNGLCAPVFDKISILTASDDLHALQLRHTPMQTEAYRAVLDKVTVIRRLAQSHTRPPHGNHPTTTTPSNPVHHTIANIDAISDYK